jgi:hypothetical protein
MKFAPLLLVSALIAACAPATLQGVGGRIVNVKTGQEGQVSFLGGFQERPALPSDPDNVKITLGSTVYSGRYTVLGSAAPKLGVSLGFGGGYSSGAVSPAFGGTAAFGSLGQRPEGGNQTRPGNLIARTPAQNGAVQTLTCTFQTDSSLHGIGNCQDSAGGSYSLQF